MSDADHASLTIDLDALAANLAALRVASGGAEVAPVVKADAYGLGIAPVARRLRAEGARSFYVARVEEALVLRDIVHGAQIFVLDGCPDGVAQRLIDADLTPVLNSLDQVSAWSRAGGGPAWLQIDTGMNRLGLEPEEAAALAASPDRLRHVEVEGVMSHLACATRPADPMNARQRSVFIEAAALFPNARASLAATAGVFLGADYAFDQVRAGVGLFGGGPFEAPHPAIAAVATLSAPILQVRTVRPGETIGYGAAFTAPATLRVAIVAAGYADGFLRAGEGRAYGVLDGRRCAVLGRISMDLTAFDVTGCDGARPGARIELVGREAPVDEVAKAAGTIPYEILLRLGARARRTYVGGS